MLGLAIRYGHLEDAEAILELDGRVGVDDLTAMLDRGSFLVLDRDQGGLAASVYVEIREGRAEVGMISVADDVDAAALTQRLIEVAEMVCVAEGCEALELCVADEAELPELSREMGYRHIDSSPDGVRLEKRLA